MKPTKGSKGKNSMSHLPVQLDDEFEEAKQGINDDENVEKEEEARKARTPKAEKVEAGAKPKGMSKGRLTMLKNRL